MKTSFEIKDHIFSDYNDLKLKIPNSLKPKTLEHTFASLVSLDGNTPFEFLISGKVIEYPDHKAMVSGQSLCDMQRFGIDASLKNIYSYDIETYPNFFSAILKNINNPVDIQTYIVYKDRDDRAALNALISQPIILVGFNSETFDDVILKYSLKAQNNSVRDFTHGAFELGQRIVKKSLNPTYWNLYNQATKFFSIDLLEIMALGVKGVSLKRAAIIMGHNKIQDLPIPFDQEIKPGDIETLIKYNLNDVEITEKLYHYIQDEIETRLSVGKLFKENLMTASRSKMGNVLITKLYQDKTGEKVKDGHDDSRIVREIALKDCIGKAITFETPELKELMARIENKIVYWPNYKFSEKITFDGVEYQLGIGGLHSVDPGRVLQSTDDYNIIDCDVASFYPRIILNNNLYPKQLGEQFTNVYRGVVDERIRAKHAGEKTLADALKISINAVFGRLGSQYSWLYDMQVFLSVTLSGQLYLLSLIEKLVKAGIEVLSANTDGIISKVHIDQQEIYEDVCGQWSDYTGFELEYTVYKKFVQRDINSYISLKPDGKYKTKGIFTKPGGIDAGYKPAIISKALQAYFIDGITPLETIKNSERITDFLIAQKAGKQFDIVYEQVTNATLESEICQKTNRYYVSNSGGSLIKVRRDNPNSKISFVAGESVVLLNDIEDYDPKSHDIKIKYYLTEINKTIHAIEKHKVKQASLF